MKFSRGPDVCRAPLSGVCGAGRLGGPDRTPRPLRLPPKALLALSNQTQCSLGPLPSITPGFRVGEEDATEEEVLELIAHFLR
jgi:hypothetical protein